MSTPEASRTAPIAASLSFALFVAAAARSLPVGAVESLEQTLGGRGGYGLLVALNLAGFGLAGPASTSIVARWGGRRVAACALVLCAAALVAGSSDVPLVVMLGLGPCLGAAAGLVAVPMAVTMSEMLATRRRGLLIGLLTGASAVGQIAALPVVAIGVAAWGRTTVLGMAGLACILAAGVVATAPATERPAASPTATRTRSRRPPRAVVLLGVVFFACGATTTGIVGTHLVPAAHDHGTSAVAATSALAAMGGLMLVGSLASGWLSDRHDPRQMLFALYVIRGLSLFFLPFALQQNAIGMVAFVVVFGLDWAASVPPIVALTREIVGPQRTGGVVGLLFVSHHVGAGLAAWGAGATQQWVGSYVLVFLLAGVVSVGAGFMAWSVPGGVRAPRPARMAGAPLDGREPAGA
jgi:predicted MFS family arabinose efflux permease